jgi:OMF family outer membrane factor
LGASLFLSGVFLGPATASSYTPKILQFPQSSNLLINSDLQAFASKDKEIVSEKFKSNASIRLFSDKAINSNPSFKESSVYHVSDFKIICSQSTSTLKQSLLNNRCMPYNPELDIQISTFGSLVNQALNFSPLLNQAQAEIKSKAATVRGQFASWYPQLSISSGSLLYTNIISTQNYGSASDSSNPSASGTAFQPSDPVSTTSSTSSSPSDIVKPFKEYASYTQAYPILTFEWKFFDPSRADKINAAKSNLNASNYEYLATKRTVASQIIKLSGELIALEHHISGLLIEYVAAQDIETLYVDNVSLGNTSTDVLSAQQSVVALLQYQIIDLLTKHQQHLAQLSILSDLKPSNLFIIDFFNENVFWPYSDDETFDLIIKSPSIEQDLALSQNYKDLAAASLKENLPKLSMLGYVSYVGTLGSTSYGPPKPPSSAWSSQLSNYIGLNLSWNIFDGFSNYNAASAYKASAEAMDFKRQQSILQAKERAVESLRLLHNAKSMKSSLSLGVESARKSLLVTLQRIQIGYEDPTSTYASQKQISQGLVQYSSLYVSIVQAFSQLFVLTGVDPVHLFDVKQSNGG